LGKEDTAQVEWLVAASPHIRARESTPRIMWSVSACLIPAAVWGVFVFGWPAAYVMVMCISACVVTEYICNRLRKRPTTVGDGSAFLTGLLLAFVLPSHSVVQQTLADGSQVVRLGLLDWRVPVIGSVVAIGIVKHCFGGLGHNIWNPALAGRAFVQLSFGRLVSPPEWPWPAGAPDAVTHATSLSKTTAAFIPLDRLFFGYCPGSIGEVSAFLLIIGAVYLMIRRYVDWRLPLGFIAALGVFATFFAWSPGGSRVAGWAAEFAKQFSAFRGGEEAFSAFVQDWGSFVVRTVFSGGAILGAFYMATDMVTSPLSRRGQLYFGLGCGFLTALIRAFSGMPEGVCYAILLMNTVRPYVDRISRPRVLGQTKEKA